MSINIANLSTNALVNPFRVFLELAKDTLLKLVTYLSMQNRELERKLIL